MKQTSLGLGQANKRTRRRVFLEEMDRVVPWSELVALISPFMPEGRRGRPPFAVEARPGSGKAGVRSQKYLIRYLSPLASAPSMKAPAKARSGRRRPAS